MVFDKPPIPGELKILTRIVGREKGRVFLVGGVVRDILLGRMGPDWDVAIDLVRDRGRAGNLMRWVLGEIAQKLNGRFIFYPQFLTGTVLFKSGSGAGEQRIDVCHTRREIYPAPAVLPKVVPAAIEEDLFRRDFTVNAIAWELKPDGLGDIIDPFYGQDDLRARLIRILHPNSFIDDPTRIFRGIRFAVRLNYEIETGTLYLLRQAVRGGYPAFLTPERILYEMRRIVLEDGFLRIMEALVREKVLAACWNWSPPRNFFIHLQRLVENGLGAEERFCYLLSLFPVTERFPITRAEQRVQAVLRTAGMMERKLKRARRKETIYRLLRGLPEPVLRVMMALNREGVGKKVAFYLKELAGIRTELTARDLLEIGFKPGPELGRVLQRLLNARLAGKVQNRYEEVKLARRWKGWLSRGKREDS